MKQNLHATQVAMTKRRLESPDQLVHSIPAILRFPFSGKFCSVHSSLIMR